MSKATILFFLAALPVILILMYVYNKDKDKEPFALLMRFFGLGIVACFLVLFISSLLDKVFPFMNYNSKSSFVDIILYAFLGVALIEESCKWIMVYFVGYNNKYFDEKYDIIVYSVFVSLGFAFFENILYVFGADTSFATAIFRGISAIPSHACDAIFMGYYLTIANLASKRGLKSIERRNKVLSVVVPTILHGIYDFCLMSGYRMFTIMFLVFVGILYNISIKKINDVSNTSTTINRFCPNCGAHVTGDFCSKCGMRQK